MSQRRRSNWSLLVKLCAWSSSLALVVAAGAAQAATKVACAGEQTTHSAHRENDPEYPLLLGQLLDPGFSDGGTMALYGGGFLEGTGLLFAVGNFAHPQASVLNHDQTNPKTYLKSDEYQQLLAFAPDIVVLGPFGWHDVLSLVPLTQFAGDYDTLIDAVSGIASQPKIALVTPVPQGGADKADGFTEINGFVKAEAAQRGLPLIDVWAAFLGKPELYQGDDFHLTVEGRNYLAEVIGDSVKELAADPGPQGGGGSGGTAGAAGSGGLGGSHAGSASVAGAGLGGSAGSGGAIGNTSGSGGAASGGSAGATTGGAFATSPSGVQSPSADSGSCSFPARPSTSPVALALVLLGLFRRKSRE